MKRLISVLSASLFIFLIACDKETVEPAPPAGPGGPSIPPVGDPSMTIYKDGVEMTAGDPTCKLTKYNSSISLNSRTFSITNWISGVKLYISITNYNWQNPPEEGILVKSYNSNVNGSSEFNVCGEGQLDDECDKAFLRYSSNSGYPFIESNITNGDVFEPGVVEITYCDTINKVISGTFDATLTPTFFESGDTTHFSGSFENLPYTIQIL